MVAEQVEIATKYAGYIERQQDEIARHRAQEELPLPADLDYRTVRGLSAEVQQKLNLHQPETIGQAARISGVTPAAISLLLVHLKRGFRRRRRRARPATRQRSDGRRDGGRGRSRRTSLERHGLAALRRRPADATRAQSSRAFLALLAKWNRTYNLTAIREPERMVTHHLLDALAVLPHLPPRAGLRVLDVGSGGGVPGHSAGDRAAGVARACCSTATTRRARSCSRRRSSSALANVEVVTARVEDYAPAAPFDVVISRAFSDLATFASASRAAPRARRLDRRDEGRVSARRDRRSCRPHVRRGRNRRARRCRGSTPSAISCIDGAGRGR